MIGYKLFRKMKDGHLAPLFINKQQRLVLGVVYLAECHPTKGFAVRPGWHIFSEMNAPHLSKKGRVWAQVEFSDYEEHIRSECQGGLWYTANYMRILQVL